jgi:hypothetical protein
MTGIGTALVLLILLAGILIHGFWKDELYFDTVHWEITEKNSAEETGEPLENYSHKYYTIPREEKKDGKP